MIKHWYDVLEKVQLKLSEDESNGSSLGSVNHSADSKACVKTLDGVVFDRKRYYYDESDSEAYLTCRETQCVYYLLHGYTMVKTAYILDLSPRTIEFYVKNIKSCHDWPRFYRKGAYRHSRNVVHTKN